MSFALLLCMSFALLCMSCPFCPVLLGDGDGDVRASGGRQPPVWSGGERQLSKTGGSRPPLAVGETATSGRAGGVSPLSGPVVSDGSRRQRAHAPRSPFGSAEDTDAVLVALLKTLCVSCPSLPVGETRETRGTRGTNECRPISAPSDTGFARNSLIPLEISDRDPPKSAPLSAIFRQSWETHPRSTNPRARTR
jgi:hypothetical protein